MTKGDKNKEDDKTMYFTLGSEESKILKSFKFVYNCKNQKEALNKMIIKYADLDDRVNKVIRLKKEVENA